MNFHRKLALLIAIALVTSASSVWADEWTFDPDEIEDHDDDDDGAMMFAPDDLDDDAYDPAADMEEALDVGVVAVPNDDLSDPERQELQRAAQNAAREVPEITVHDDANLLPTLVDRGADYCSRESLCLARVGEAGDVDRIVQVRVEREPGGDYRLDIDYFDVGGRLFVAYHSNTGLGGLDDVIEAIPAGVDDIFGIRRGRDGDEFVDQRDVDVLKVLTGFTGIAAALSLGAGGFFGMRARSQQEELDTAERDSDGRYVDLTQAEARSKQRSMESSARNANISFVTGGVLAAATIGLFFLRSDDDELDGDASWYQPDSVSPGIGKDGFGVGASWSF